MLFPDLVKRYIFSAWVITPNESKMFIEAMIFAKNSSDVNPASYFKVAMVSSTL